MSSGARDLWPLNDTPRFAHQSQGYAAGPWPANPKQLTVGSIGAPGTNLGKGGCKLFRINWATAGAPRWYPRSAIGTRDGEGWTDIFPVPRDGLYTFTFNAACFPFRSGNQRPVTADTSTELVAGDAPTTQTSSTGQPFVYGTMAFDAPSNSLPAHGKAPVHQHENDAYFHAMILLTGPTPTYGLDPVLDMRAVFGPYSDAHCISTDLSGQGRPSFPVSIGHKTIRARDAKTWSAVGDTTGDRRINFNAVTTTVFLTKGQQVAAYAGFEDTLEWPDDAFADVNPAFSQFFLDNERTFLSIEYESMSDARPV